MKTMMSEYKLQWINNSALEIAEEKISKHIEIDTIQSEKSNFMK